MDVAQEKDAHKIGGSQEAPSTINACDDNARARSMTARQKQEINTNVIHVKQSKTRHSLFVVQPEVNNATISTKIQRLPDKDLELLGRLKFQLSSSFKRRGRMHFY